MIGLNFILLCLNNSGQIAKSDVSVISFRMGRFATIGFGFVVVMDFDLSLPVGDKFFQPDDCGTVGCLLGLDRMSE